MRKMEGAKEWFVYMLIGFVAGTVAYAMISTEEFLLNMQVLVIQTVLRGECEFKYNGEHPDLVACFKAGTCTRLQEKTLSVDPLYFRSCHNNTDVIPFVNTVKGWLAYAFFAGVLGLLAGLMTTYYG